MAKVSNVTFQYVLKALNMKTKIAVGEMLDIVRLNKNELNKPGGKIESEKLTEIFRYCMKKTANPYLALEIGESIPYQSLGLLGYLLLNTKSLKEMIEKFSHYQKLISARLKFNFFEDEKFYKIAVYINENRHIPVPGFHAEVHLSAILSILTQILGKKVVPAYSSFSFDKPPSLKKYEEIFSNKIYFGRDENAIFFEKGKLDIKVDNSNPSMLAFFEAQADLILQEMEKNSWYSKVEREILKNIGDKDITIEFISSNLGLSVRTLQNYLKSESKKFTDALGNVRKRLAEHYIKNTKIDDITISFLLGYSEVSSFYRAYRKWNGNTPKNRRKELSGSDQLESNKAESHHKHPHSEPEDGQVAVAVNPCRG